MIANRNTRSMTTWALVLLISVASVGLLPAIAIGAKQPMSLPFSVDLFPGQRLIIRFRFPTPPTTPEGPADILLINGGSGVRGLIATQVSLSAGRLIGSYTNTMGNAFAIFTDPSSLYTIRLNPADLSSLFSDDREAVLEFQPIVDPNVVDAHANLQFNFFFAARGVSADTFVEAVPTPVITDVQIRHGQQCVD
jgi:hypothetical protein